MYFELDHALPTQPDVKSMIKEAPDSTWMMYSVFNSFLKAKNDENNDGVGEFNLVGCLFGQIIFH